MKPIRLIRYTSSVNGNGRPVETASESYNVFAALVKTGGSRETRNGKTVLEDTIKFNVYFREGFLISGSWRLVWAGKEYTVERIDRIEERRFNWQITASGKS